VRPLQTQDDIDVAPLASTRFWPHPEPGPWKVAGGLGWFVAQAVAMWIGVWPLAVVVGSVAALAAGQLTRAWISEGERADFALAMIAAGLLPVSAAAGTRALGAAVVAGVAVSVVAAAVRRGSDTPPIRDAGFTIQSWLPVGMAAAAMVLTYRYEVGAAVWLLCLVSIFDAGQYLTGAGSARLWEGPIAGIAGVGVVAFTLTVVGVPPFTTSAATRFALAAVLLIPAGIVVGSALVPRQESNVGGLHRVDSMLLLSPIWAWAVGRYVASFA